MLMFASNINPPTLESNTLWCSCWLVLRCEIYFLFIPDILVLLYHIIIIHHNLGRVIFSFFLLPKHPLSRQWEMEKLQTGKPTPGGGGKVSRLHWSFECHQELCYIRLFVPILPLSFLSFPFRHQILFVKLPSIKLLGVIFAKDHGIIKC